MEITESKKRTEVRAVSTKAPVSIAGRVGQNPPGPWGKYTKKRSRSNDEIASKRAKAAIKA